MGEKMREKKIFFLQYVYRFFGPTQATPVLNIKAFFKKYALGGGREGEGKRPQLLSGACNKLFHQERNLIYLLYASILRGKMMRINFFYREIFIAAKVCAMQMCPGEGRTPPKKYKKFDSSYEQGWDRGRLIKILAKNGACMYEIHGKLVCETG